jgi:ammonia channel protein AmtB
LPIPSFAAAELVFELFSILLVPFVIGGLSLLNTSLGRSRRAAHAMMSSLGALSVAGVAD